MPRTTTVLAASAGIAAIAAAGVLRFAVVPAQAQLPADLDTERNYDGTITSLLVADALAAGDLANAVVTDLPVELTRTLQATSVADGVATVAEQGVITAPDGSTVLTTSATHVVDRRTMLAADDRTGLLIGWPIGTEQRDYVGWSAELAAPVDLAFVGVEEHAGIETYVFSADFDGRIVDEATLARFPAALPKAILPAAAEALSVSPAIAGALPQLMEVLPDEVPLAYTLDSATTYWVEPTTGMVIDLDRTEARRVSIDLDTVPPVALADVFGITYVGDEASVAATVDEANDAISQLSLYGTTMPIGMTVLGVALLALAAIRSRRDGGDGEVVELPETDPASTQRQPINA